MSKIIRESIRKIIRQELESLMEGTEDKSLYVLIKTGGNTIAKKLKPTSPFAWQKMQKYSKEELLTMVKEKQVTSIQEGPEERLGAYRRLVITSTKIPALKAEFTKFTARPEIKADFPVKMTFFDSPKPNVLVVDLNGDNATVLATKFSDIIKRTDAGAKVLVRTERKLK